MQFNWQDACIICVATFVSFSSPSCVLKQCHFYITDGIASANSDWPPMDEMSMFRDPHHVSDISYIYGNVGLIRHNGNKSHATRTYLRVQIVAVHCVRRVVFDSPPRGSWCGRCINDVSSMSQPMTRRVAMLRHRCPVAFFWFFLLLTRLPISLLWCYLVEQFVSFCHLLNLETIQSVQSTWIAFCFIYGEFILLKNM